MKKLATLLLAAGMVVAASAPASAVDVKMDGEYIFTFISGQRLLSGDNFDGAGQRFRLGMTFTASEDLSGYVQLQAGIGEDDNTVYDWGTNNNARTKIGVRQAYVDWMIPNTTVKVRMGKQLVGLPQDAFGKNAIMHPGLNSRDGVVLSSPVTDWLDVTAFWVRAGYKSDTTLVDGKATSNYDTSKSAKADVFAASAAMKFDGFAVTPYVMYGAMDKGTKFHDDGISENNASADAYWFGVTSTLSYFDPFTLKLSGAYGLANLDSEYGDNDRSGWYVQTMASYKTAYGTPFLGAWYGSGDDRDAQYAKQGWIPSVAGRFHPSFGFTPGEYGLYDTQFTAHHAIGGTWGVSAGIKEVSFLENLTHAFSVTMYKGTNSDGNSLNENPIEYMTYSDTAIDFNLDTTYMIYKNLAANLQLAYIINDFDKDDHADFGKVDEDSWSAALSFAYKF